MPKLKTRIVAAITWLQEVRMQWICLLIRHDGIQESGSGEAFLRCARCHRRSPGIRPGPVAPILKHQGDPTRHVLRRDLPCPGAVAIFPKRTEDTAFVGRLTDEGAALVADLMDQGRDDQVQLLLADTDGRVH